MKAMHFTMLVLSAFLLHGCGPIIYLAYGVKKPGYEPLQKIQQRALELGIDTIAMRHIRPEKYTATLHRIHTFPNTYIFNAEGNLVAWQTSEDDCKNDLADFLRNLKTGAPGTADGITMETVQSELEVLQTPTGQALKSGSPPDYYAVIYWGTFLGKVNDAYLPDWINACRNNPHCRIEPVPVNCDMLKLWKKRYE